MPSFLTRSFISAKLTSSCWKSCSAGCTTIRKHSATLLWFFATPQSRQWRKSCRPSNSCKRREKMANNTAFYKVCTCGRVLIRGEEWAFVYTFTGDFFKNNLLGIPIGETREVHLYHEVCPTCVRQETARKHNEACIRP